MRVASWGWAALLATGLLAVAACGEDDTTGGSGPGTLLELTDVPMSGDQEVPPVQSTASGTASASLTGNLLRVTGSFQGLTSDLMAVQGSAAHVHDGPMGQAGPVVFNLRVTPGADNRSGTFDGEMLLDQNQLAALQAGRYYVNVHTTGNPAGELRGQLAASDEEQPPESLDQGPGQPEISPRGNRAAGQPPTFPATIPEFPVLQPPPAP